MYHRVQSSTAQYATLSVVSSLDGGIFCSLESDVTGRSRVSKPEDTLINKPLKVLT